MSACEDDYAVTYKTDIAEVRRENATLRARLRAKEEECDRWARRWAASGLVESSIASVIADVALTASAPKESDRG